MRNNTDMSDQLNQREFFCTKTEDGKFLVTVEFEVVEEHIEEFLSSTMSSIRNKNSDDYFVTGAKVKQLYFAGFNPKKSWKELTAKLKETIDNFVTT